MSAPQHFFATCQVGFEAALKADVERFAPHLRPAFARPGFVTFKSEHTEEPQDALSFVMPSPFARQWGLCLGAMPGGDAGLRLAWVKDKLSSIGVDGASARLHAWDRDQCKPEKRGDTESSLGAREWAAQVKNEFGGDSFAQAGDLVVDVIGADADKLWLGVHRHTVAHAPFEGGVFPQVVPSEAPSRAYLKAEEAITRFGIPLKTGETVAEIGAAPGGAVWGLLQRGLHVVGIDAAALDTRLGRYAMPGAQPKLIHVKKSAIDVRAEDLPRRVDWLFLDANTDPSHALFITRSVWRLIRKNARGVVLTLKLNDPSLYSQVPAFLDEIASWSLKIKQARQLYSHRSEIVVFAESR